MSSDPIIGKKLGDYIIVDILGQGGMARVYRGLDKKLNRYAAVKVIDASAIREDEAEYRQRFQNEARAIARLSHPNIVGIYQYDQIDNLYYMAMSFIEGKDLRSILKTHDKNGTHITSPEVLRIVRDIGVEVVDVLDGVAGAVAHIRGHGSAHTDSIVTEDKTAAEEFLATLDSAVVLHNASTQFADGGEFGFGGEIGIATGRLHARGPVGARELTTYKYVVRGDGQVRG